AHVDDSPSKPTVRRILAQIRRALRVAPEGHPALILARRSDHYRHICVIFEIAAELALRTSPDAVKQLVVLLVDSCHRELPMRDPVGGEFSCANGKSKQERIGAAPRGGACADEGVR